MDLTHTPIAVQNYIYRVDGVNCTKCIAKIRQLSRSDFQIENLRFNLANKTLTLDAPNTFAGEKYILALKKLGYTAKDITASELHETSDYQKENKLFLIRLGVAGACAGNIMLLSFALYLGAEDTVYAGPLSWLSFVFYIPALLFSGYPILHKSVSALKNLTPSVDLPIALALLVGGALSFRNLVQGNPNIYFDSLAGLIFFLLCTRYLVFQIKNKFLTPLSMAEILPSKTTRLKKATQTEFISTDITNIEPEDYIDLQAQYILPVDGILLSDKAEFDTSLLTGESFPVTYKKFDRVYSGSKLLSSRALIEAQSTARASRIHEIFERLNAALTQKTELVTLTDKAAQILTYVILGTSALFLTFYSGASFDEKLHRVLALLVVACPCALAIATPLALSLGVKRLFHKDILIKNPDAFEKINHTKHVIFDKTGTLTQSSLEVTQWHPRRPTQEEQDIIFALERRSEHPVAKALLRSVNPQNLDLKLDVLERIGEGVKAHFNDDLYSLEKSHEQQGQVVFTKNHIPMLHISFSSTLQEDAKWTLDFLRIKKIESYLLSGDNQKFSEQIGGQLGFESQNIIYDQTPESKADFVERFKSRHVLYVGDGLNDSIAMAKSNLSISVNNSVEATFKASDVHFNKSGIAKIIPLFEVSKDVLQTIKRNLMLSTIYNLTFGTLALSGVITPLMTAIIMPTSSFTVIGLTFYFLYLKAPHTIGELK